MRGCAFAHPGAATGLTMMRALAASLVLLLVPAHAAAQEPAPDPREPTEAEIAAFEACMAEVDTAAIDAFSEEMLERNSEITAAIDAACARGQRSAAAALYAPLMAEYSAHPEVAKLRACIAALDAARGVAEDEPHVCDDE